MRQRIQLDLPSCKCKNIFSIKNVYMYTIAVYIKKTYVVGPFHDSASEYEPFTKFIQICEGSYSDAESRKIHTTSIIDKIFL